MKEFKLNLEKKFMMILIVTVIKYYKERPGEFQDINALRMKQLSEIDNLLY